MLICCPITLKSLTAFISGCIHFFCASVKNIATNLADKNNTHFLSHCFLWFLQSGHGCVLCRAAVSVLLMAGFSAGGRICFQAYEAAGIISAPCGQLDWGPQLFVGSHPETSQLLARGPLHRPAQQNNLRLQSQEVTEFPSKGDITALCHHIQSASSLSYSVD